MGKKKILMLLVLLIYFIFINPIIFSWSQQVNAIALLVIMQILWIGRVVPYVQSTFILMILLSIHFSSFESVVSYLGSEIVWLVFTTYIISKAFLKSGLAERFSLKMLHASRGSGKLLLLSSYLIMIVLAVFVPSNIGRTSLVASSLDQVLRHLNQLIRAENVAKGMFVGVAILSGISGIFVTTGASSTIYTYGMIQKSSTLDITYLYWIVLFMLPVFLLLFFLWIVTLYIFPIEKIDRKFLAGYINEKVTALGSITKTEIKMLCIMGFTVSLWVFHSEIGYSISMISTIGALLTLLPYVGIWDWKEAKDTINWETILFFASTLMLSNMLIDSGALSWFARFSSPLFQSNRTSIVILTLIIVVMLLRIMFVNVLGFLTIMVPFALILGEQLSVGSPALFAMVVFLAGVPGFFLVTQSPSHIISYSYEYFKSKDLLKVGGILSIVWVAIIMLSAFVYWPLVT